MQALTLFTQFITPYQLLIRDDTPAFSGQENQTRYALTVQYATGPVALWDKDGSSRGDLRHGGLIVNATDVAARTAQGGVSFVSGPLFITLTAKGTITTRRYPTTYTVALTYAPPANAILEVRREALPWQAVAGGWSEGSYRWQSIDDVGIPFTDWRLMLNGHEVDKGAVEALRTGDNISVDTTLQPIGYAEKAVVVFATEAQTWTNLTLASLDEPTVVQRIQASSTEKLTRLREASSLLDLLGNESLDLPIDTRLRLLTRLQDQLAQCSR